VPDTVTNFEVWLKNGVPSVHINAVDVSTPSGVSLPSILGSLILGFGAGINPESLSGLGDAFSVTFERISLEDLPD
jgi:hypothetical protein